MWKVWVYRACERTMQMHNGKCHQKNIECGLCKYEAKDIEKLDLHIATCEMLNMMNVNL